MTPEKKAATVREARLKLQKDVDSGVDTEASKKVLLRSIPTTSTQSTKDKEQ